jgi:uncharacterized protein
MQEILTNTDNDFEAPQQPEPLLIRQPTPNDPPWNSGVALGTWFASVLMILVIPGLVLLPYILSVSGGYADNVELAEFIRTDTTAIILQLAAIIPAHLITIFLAWLVVTKARRFSFREMLGWQAGGLTWWIWYAAIIVGFFIVTAIVSHFFPEQENDLIRILKSSRTAVYMVAIMATLTAPLVEEVIYRGILFSAFQRTFGVTFAVVSVTFLFAIVHVPQYYPSFSTIFLLTLLSLILTLVRVRTNNLLPCVILHTLFNAIQSAALILEPFLTSESSPAEVTAVIQLIK